MKLLSRKRLAVVGVALVLILMALTAWKVRFNDKEGFDGIFVLKGENGKWLEITDDLFPEEAERLLFGRSADWLKHVASFGACGPTDTACLNYEWNFKVGRGFIKTTYLDGSKLLICLSRFKDSQGRESKGLFVGGDLPSDDPDFAIFNKNETGMAYFDGKRYFHIWCNVNEGIFAVDRLNTPIYPGDWEFLSSDIMESGKNGVTLRSRHRTRISGEPVNIDKMLFYHTGDKYFTLVTNIVNIGNKPVTFFHQYGDEPWLGNFGSSVGNVGWLKDRLLQTETVVNPKINSYAGMYDYGNELIGEKPGTFTGKANFIEWEKNVTGPDMVYFSNQSAPPATSGKVPLSSYNNRFIGLIWGPRTLAPGQNLVFTLNVGMAEPTKNGIPVIPKTGLNKK